MWLLRLFLLITGLFPYLPTAADVLPASEVFKPTVESVSANEIRIDIAIKPNYYLYRQRLFSVIAANQAIVIEDVTLSEGSEKTDNFFGTQSIWYGGKDTATVTITYQNPNQATTAAIALKYQGCHDGIICYPPETVSLPLTLPKAIPAAKQQNHQPLFNHTSTNQRRSQSSGGNSWLDSAAKTKTSPLLKTDNKAILSEDQAFPLSLEIQDKTTWVLRWHIADGYYLYRDKINITAANGNLAQVQLSPGQSHVDAFFGEQTVYRHKQAIAQLYLKQPIAEQTLQVSFQGCADKGICYPIMQRLVTQSQVTQITENLPAQVTEPINQASGNGTMIEQLTQTLKSNLWLGIGLLILAGIALALTPCVLPMLPILLGILTNQRQTGKVRSAILSSTYVLGMATTLAVFGLIVAKTGINIQIIFQRPVWLILFAAIFMLMGLAMLGVFSVAMPSRVQTAVIGWQNRFQTNRVIDVFVVGALSSLVVGPCIAPPLIAILAFIATTDDSVLGAVYLFALGVGMGLPLIIFATVVTQIPKTGELSRLVTRILAMLMFAVGLWLFARLLPGAVSLVLWGVWLVIVAYWLWSSRFIRNYAQKTAKTLAAIGFAVGLTWVAGGFMGNSNPLKPFSQVVYLPFQSVQNLAELETIIAQSSQPVMLDLYADWCVSCQEIEQMTLTDKRVVEALNDWKLLKLDITETNAEHREIMAKLNLIGPPALLFFRQGAEIKSARNIGKIDADTLLNILKSHKMTNF